MNERAPRTLFFSSGAERGLRDDWSERITASLSITGTPEGEGRTQLNPGGPEQVYKGIGERSARLRM